MKQRDAALKKSLKSGLKTDRLIQTLFLRNSKANFFLIKEAKGNPKLLWQCIDQLSGTQRDKNGPIELYKNHQTSLATTPGTQDTQKDSLVVANMLNDYLIDSVLALSHSPIKAQPVTALMEEIPYLNLVHTSKLKVAKILSSLANSRAKDSWGNDQVLIKKHKDTLALQISCVINKSFDESMFPSSLKTAIVTPIFKSGDRHETCNYRPISILPVISKVTEKVVAEQLSTHLNNTSRLHPMQFGFRANHSAETACCLFLENIKVNLDKRGVVGAVFLDLRRASDTVNHSVLLSKLSHFGFSSSVPSWLEAYLNSRTQCVRIRDKVSPQRACTMAVPQGLVLGPLLFSLYINDLPSVCDDMETLMYVDDKVIFMYGKDADTVAAKLSAAMGKIAVWLSDSCPTLNTEKTVTLYFSNKRNLSERPNVFVNGQMIKNVEEFKYLGVILDSTLSFKKTY